MKRGVAGWVGDSVHYRNVYMYLRFFISCCRLFDYTFKWFCKQIPTHSHTQSSAEISNRTA